MLDRYWTVLNENGVHYDRQDVQLDYRIGQLGPTPPASAASSSNCATEPETTRRGTSSSSSPPRRALGLGACHLDGVRRDVATIALIVSKSGVVVLHHSPLGLCYLRLRSSLGLLAARSALLGSRGLVPACFSEETTPVAPAAEVVTGHRSGRGQDFSPF